MITEDYVSFEVAKLLKEKGFNIQCRAAYTNYGKIFTTQIQQYITNILCSKGELWECTAPTHQMAMKWLREVHNIHIIVFRYDNSSFPYIWYIFGHNKEKPQKANSYEEAVEAALKYALENLI